MVTPLILILLAAALPARAGILEKYFSSGWASVAPLDPPKPPEGLLIAGGPEEDGGPVEGQHGGAAHMYITRKAFELYERRYPGSELGRYIGQYSEAGPASGSDDNVVEGSHDEDFAFENPFGEAVPVLRHFWNWRGGPSKGLWGFDSGVNRAHKYFTGGYGLNGRYDPDWSGDGEGKRGERGQGILALYRKGEKAKAYWFLGHAAHLLEDLTVPAHNHLWPHPTKNADRYETYMKDHHQNWSTLPAWPTDSFADLYSLYLETAKVAEGYDAGNSDGDSGVDGSADQGRRREGGFSKEELKEEGNVLMPLAVARVALLFQYFFRQVDRQPPAVKLKPFADGSGVELEASDDVSGVDPVGFAFEVQSAADGGQREPVVVEGTVFRVEPGRAVRVVGRARDAVGNIGRSAPAALSR